jgi:hypothetical protein
MVDSVEQGRDGASPAIFLLLERKRFIQNLDASERHERNHRRTFKKCQTEKSPRSMGWGGVIVPDQLSVVWYKRLNCLRHGSARYRLPQPR